MKVVQFYDMIGYVQLIYCEWCRYRSFVIDLFYDLFAKRNMEKGWIIERTLRKQLIEELLYVALTVIFDYLRGVTRYKI